MRALIVDDSRFIRRVLRRVLEEHGINCLEATNGQEGLEKLRAVAPVELALIDWNMPIMDGLSMLKRLRAEGFTETKVMMVTTEAENDFILQALEAGADEYLMKPFDREAFSEKLSMLGLSEG
jgi:two-component system chemotaxis response regulator CheY